MKSIAAALLMFGLFALTSPASAVSLPGASEVNLPSYCPFIDCVTDSLYVAPTRIIDKWNHDGVVYLTTDAGLYTVTTNWIGSRKAELQISNCYAVSISGYTCIKPVSFKGDSSKGQFTIALEDGSRFDVLIKRRVSHIDADGTAHECQSSYCLQHKSPLGFPSGN